MTNDASITEFSIPSIEPEQSCLFFAGVPHDIIEHVHQCSDLSAVYYAPEAAFVKLKTIWPATTRERLQTRTIPADSVILLHCSTYTQRYDYRSEEANMKAIMLSKGYDVGICTGRSLTKHYCSDLMYTDRYFSYRFGDRKYWFICYSSSLDKPELISDKLGDLFGPDRGPEIYVKLSQTTRHKVE